MTRTAWIVQTIIALILSSGIAWATWATTIAQKHETRITVIETRLGTIVERLDEIKADQKEIKSDVNRLLILIEAEEKRKQPTWDQPRIYGR